MKSAYRAELTCAVQLRISDQNAWSRVGTEDERCNATRITSLLFTGERDLDRVGRRRGDGFVDDGTATLVGQPDCDAVQAGLMPVVFQLIAVRRLPSVGGSMAPRWPVSHS